MDFDIEELLVGYTGGYPNAVLLVVIVGLIMLSLAGVGWVVSLLWC